MKTSSTHHFILTLLFPLFLGLNHALIAQEAPRANSPMPEVPRATLATQSPVQQSPSMQNVPRATLTDYSLSPGDVVNVKVFQEDDLESTLRISDDGTITFPLIGVVRIGGMTAQAASQVIRAALDKRYLINPQVSLSVTEYTKRRFTVLGQVQKPGSYEMFDRDSLTLLQAIGMAGGYTRIADPSKIVLKRAGNGSDEVIKINASRMAKDDSTAGLQVLPGDVITVRESIF